MTQDIAIHLRLHPSHRAALAVVMAGRHMGQGLPFETLASTWPGVLRLPNVQVLTPPFAPILIEVKERDYQSHISAIKRSILESKLSATDYETLKRLAAENDSRWQALRVQLQPTGGGLGPTPSAPDTRNHLAELVQNPKQDFREKDPKLAIEKWMDHCNLAGRFPPSKVIAHTAVIPDTQRMPNKPVVETPTGTRIESR